MYEQQFLAYILYSTLVQFRAQGLETNDKPLFWISDLLHNIPLQLLDEDKSKAAFERLEANVRTYEIDKWLEDHRKGFLMSFPEYRPENAAGEDNEVVS
ncbi:hypothetical protein CLV59_105402 [Chitinophaga dinghuensis]|uniref:Uncharacterized protein n=1 Tax=Chitinophaga dinghuensis TaxID=1539050 RepID=A0A327VY68_9BACT|nr:hypothetical protein [Chitinophaga dinghuensis]RAJ80293.1 hypothetical protein CLV59_105402 [Chitinophaga dinghuensis]